MSNSVESQNMKFTGTSYTVAEFKQLCGCDKIHVMPKKEKAGEIFFVCGAKRGYISGATKVPKNPIISRCERINPAEGEDQFFFMMHEAPNLDNSAVAVL